ncbi:MAG: 4-hydroxy-tetrahydrodipicolinate reductase [Bacteroidales bacterium]|nr:4-hydroxy-tetrahydrodipicolinate reductase [Bacteroidales bacterium]
MKIILSGYGRMGRMIEGILNEKGIEIVDRSEDICSTDPEIAKECVCIDFTFPESFRKNYKFLAANFKAVVLGTTGWYDIKDEIFAEFEKQGTPLVWASNFSIGVNVLFAAVDKISSLLGKTGGYDPYLVEMHHIHKLDAPSGTGASLGRIVDENMGGKVEIQSVRCGEIAGIHTVGFEGHADRITITHEAFSREGFARGAVEAAIRADKLEPGIYEFKDLILK